MQVNPKPWQTWALFTVFCAIAAYFAVDNWFGRMVGFLWMWGVTVIFVRAMAKRQAAAGKSK